MPMTHLSTDPHFSAPLWRIDYACKFLGISRGQVYRLHELNKIRFARNPAVRVVYVHREDLEKVFPANFKAVSTNK